MSTSSESNDIFEVYPFLLPFEAWKDKIVYADPSNINYNADARTWWTNIRAAHPSLIVDMITTMKFHDSAFIQHVLLTHRDWIFPNDFLALLTRKYDPPPANATEEQKKRYEQEKGFIRSSSIIIAKRWLAVLRPSDFKRAPTLYENILAFINSTPDNFHSELFSLLFKARNPTPKAAAAIVTVDPKNVDTASATMRISTGSVMSPSGRPRSGSNPLSPAKAFVAGALGGPVLGGSTGGLPYIPGLLSPPGTPGTPGTPGSASESSNTANEHSFTPQQIAQEITIMDFEYFSALTPLEFVGLMWNKKPRQAPNIVAATEWFNRVSCWITSKIISKESAENRAIVIEGFISIAMHLLELRNYSGLMCVMSTLHSSAISRLKQTWAFVSAKHEQDLELIDVMMNPEKNFKNYRKILQEVPMTDPCVPILGVFLTDYTFMDENEPIVHGLINVERIILIGQKLKEFLMLQQRPYTELHKNDQVRHSILAERLYDENEIFNLSKLREESSNTPPALAAKRRVSTAASKLRLMSFVTNELDASISSVLGERDWQILLSSSKDVTFPTSDIVFDEGEKPGYLYRVVSGTARQRTSGPGLLSGVVGPGQMFGDLALLNGGISVSRIIVESTVTVKAIETSFILKLFETEHALAATFFKHVACNLAQQFKTGTRGLAQDAEASFEDEFSFLLMNQASNEDSKNLQDVEYCTRFGLPADEVVIKTYSTKHGGISGTIYISQHFICFYGSVFGLTKMKTYPFADITRIEKFDDRRLLLNKHGSKNAVRKFTFKSANEHQEAYGIIISIWKTLARSITSSSLMVTSPQHASALQKSKSSPPGSPLSPSRMGKSPVGLPTKEEWEMFLKGAKLTTFKKGDVLIREGSDQRRLYQIQKGKCTAEKAMANGKPEIVTVLRDQDLFGESTFLLGGTSALSVVAQSDTVEVYVIESSFINMLLNSKPLFAPKFFRFVGVTLLKRLQAFQDKTSLNSPKSQRRNHDKTPPTSPTTMTSSPVSQQPFLKFTNTTTPTTPTTTATATTATSTTTNGVNGGGSNNTSSSLSPRSGTDGATKS